VQCVAPDGGAMGGAARWRRRVLRVDRGPGAMGADLTAIVASKALVTGAAVRKYNV